MSHSITAHLICTVLKYCKHSLMIFHKRYDFIHYAFACSRHLKTSDIHKETHKSNVGEAEVSTS